MFECTVSLPLPVMRAFPTVSHMHPALPACCLTVQRLLQDDAERRQRLAAAATALSPEVQALIDRSMSVGDSDDDDEDDPDDEHASDTGQLPAAGPAQPRHAAAPLHHQPQHAADPLHHQHQDPPQHAAERHQQQQQHAADPGQHHRQGQHRSLQGVPQQLQEVSEDAQEVAELEGWQEQQSAADLNQADAAAEMREGPPEPHAAGMHDVDNTPIIKPEDMEAEDEEDEDDGPQVCEDCTLTGSRGLNSSAAEKIFLLHAAGSRAVMPQQHIQRSNS